MDKAPLEPGEFALEILREHPQISFENAISAANYSGIAMFSAEHYRAAQSHLGISPGSTERATELASLRQGGDGGDEVIRTLEEIPGEFAETAAFRRALVDIRSVVHAALRSL